MHLLHNISRIIENKHSCLHTQNAPQYAFAPFGGDRLPLNTTLVTMTQREEEREKGLARGREEMIGEGIGG